MKREWQQCEMMLHLRMKEHELRQKAIFWSLNLQEQRRVTAPGADRGMETRTLPRAPPTRAENGPASRGPRTLRRPRPAARQLTPLLSGLRRAGRGGDRRRLPAAVPPFMARGGVLPLPPEASEPATRMGTRPRPARPGAAPR